jgi:phosphatidylethanolamine/phosphatidyl-N-methylethanolamine N-methyltransferase
VSGGSPGGHASLPGGALAERWRAVRWSLYAPIYDAIGTSTRAARRRSFELLDLQPGERLLVVGCGTGLDFEFVPPGVTVEAVDVSPVMARRAGRRAAVLLPAARVQVMDATSLAFPDAAFDAVVLHLILAVLPDPAACVREVTRVLRPGGRAAVLDKFVPGDCQPGRARRVLDRATRLAATSITTCLEELFADGPLAIERQEPSMLRGQFRVALLRRD